jgi:hypothetical protein
MTPKGGPLIRFFRWSLSSLSRACRRPAKSRSQRGLGRAGCAAESGEVTLSRTGNSGGIGFQSQRFELAATPIGVQVSQAFDVKPRGSRPSTAALTNWGERKARESVKLI